MTGRVVLRGVSAVAVAMLVGSCTTLVSGSAVPGRDAGDVPRSDAATTSAAPECEAVSAPLVTIPAREAGEPTLRIPQPPGWNRFTALDSDLVRYVLRNNDLAADRFAPNAVVTLESKTGVADEEDVLDEEEAGVDQLGATDLVSEPTTRCGYHARLATFTLPETGQVPMRGATTLAVVARLGDVMYAATVTMQAANAGDPAYTDAVRTILTGFEMLPPGR